MFRRSWFTVRTHDPDHLDLELRWTAAPCEQRCVFCPKSWDRPRTRPLSDRRVRSVLAELDRILASHDASTVVLESGDILRFEGLFEMLDRLAGRRVHLITPGRPLADPAFVERFAGRDVRFHLTLLSDEPGVQEAMTGVPSLFEELRAAMANLRAHDSSDVQLSTVVTSVNLHALPGIVDDAVGIGGASDVAIRWFYPDLRRAPAGYDALYPTFDEVGPALARVLERCADGLPRLLVSNVPLCQVDLTGLPPHPIEWVAPPNTMPAPRPEACEGCPMDDDCTRVPDRYRTHHQPGPFDQERVRANLAWLEAAARQEATPPGTRWPLDAAGTLELVAEPAQEGRAYWWRSSELGVYWVDCGAEPAARQDVERRLGAIRTRLEALPAVSVAELGRLAAAIRVATPGTDSE